MIEVIRKINPNIRVLMMSGYAEEAISQYQTFDKSLPLLAKPFEVKELLRHVRRVLDKDIKIPDEKSCQSRCINDAVTALLKIIAFNS